MASYSSFLVLSFLVWLTATIWYRLGFTEPRHPKSPTSVTGIMVTTTSTGR